MGPRVPGSQLTIRKRGTESTDQTISAYVPPLLGVICVSSPSRVSTRKFGMNSYPSSFPSAAHMVLYVHSFLSIVCLVSLSCLLGQHYAAHSFQCACACALLCSCACASVFLFFMLELLLLDSNESFHICLLDWATESMRPEQDPCLICVPNVSHFPRKKENPSFCVICSDVK